MKIIIKETSAIENLSIIDPKSGVDYISDFVGNTGALIDGQFEWDEDIDAYLCDQETFDWWDAVVTANQSLNDRVHELVQVHDSKTVYEVINAAGSVDLGDHAANVNQALDEAFGSAGLFPVADAFFADAEINADGNGSHFEIGSQYTLTGNPVFISLNKEHFDAQKKSEQVTYVIEVSIENADCVAFVQWLKSKGHSASIINSECSFVNGMPEFSDRYYFIYKELYSTFLNESSVNG